MTPRLCTRPVHGLLALVGLGVGLTVSCLEPPAGPHPGGATDAGLTPALTQALARFNRGAALIEQYRYAEAATAFRQVVAAAPTWTAARFNLGLALLNMQDQQGAASSLSQAREAFEAVLAADPEHPHARFCLGLLHEHLGEHEAAAACFARVRRADPNDPYVVYKHAEALLALERRDEGIAALERVVALDPGFVSALYRLAIQYQRTGRRDEARPLFARFKALKSEELAGGSYTVSKTYGTVGRYYRVLGANDLPLPRLADAVGPRILFAPEVEALGSPTVAWRGPNGGSSLPGLAAGDLDGDGDLDLCLTALDAAGATALWLNDGTGRFAAQPPLADGGLCPSLGDVDNDGDLDLWLGRLGADALLLNPGDGRLAPVPVEDPPPAMPWTGAARLVDLDSDGDLDLLALRQERGHVPAAGTASTVITVLRNNRDGSYADVTDDWAPDRPRPPLAGLVCDDFDGDRDLDLIALGARGSDTQVWANDRAWRFHRIPAESAGLDLDGSLVSAVTGDPDGDGDRDLLVFAGNGLHLLRNEGPWRFRPDAAFAARFGSLRATGGQFADLDNDGDLDLLLADAARGDGTHGPRLLLNTGHGRFVAATRHDPGNLLEALTCPGPASCVAADFTGDGLLDCLWAPSGAAPILLRNVTAGGHWLQIDLRGQRGEDHKSRSNNSAVGARVDLKAGRLAMQYRVGGTSGPVASPPLRIHAGLGRQTHVDWLRITWPDAVLQAELEIPADQRLVLSEVQRKVSSCPHLFAWNGHGFELVSDFGGMGGMGYLAEPGVYPTPDPTEYVPIPRMAPRNGRYVLQVVEPIEEAVYFDEAKLLAVDHPVGTRVVPNEMMAVNSAPPAFELFTWREAIAPLRVTNHRGEDVREALARTDRHFAGATDADPDFVGFAETHHVTFDFGDRLSRLGPQDRVVLLIQGWVHYSYSAVNYAAAQAGRRLRAPSVAVERDGHWETLFEEVGYPAGLRHTMTLELTGRLRATDRRVRIDSNMELYYDRIALVVLVPADLRVQEIAVERADLHFLGYPKEVSPDGRQPKLYDYDSVDRTIPWKLQSGDYTRYGEVTELMHAADDCYAIMGPGDELTLTFDPAHLAPPLPGTTRSFILKTDSYCKDMDLYTAHPETLTPLPFHGMSAYPYDANEAYPQDAYHRDYQRRYNRRRVTDPRHPPETPWSQAHGTP